MKLRDLNLLFYRYMPGLQAYYRRSDLEKTLIRIPQTPSIADVSMIIGDIRLVSVVNLMACKRKHCSLAGNYMSAPSVSQGGVWAS